jgi:hypothetical protein
MDKIVKWYLAFILVCFLIPKIGKSQTHFHAVRFVDNPLIVPEMLDGDAGENINGPSLVKVPDWVQNPLGKYYLYFAHHRGKYIRMAYSDSLKGPWKIYNPGVLILSETVFGDGPDQYVEYKGSMVSAASHVASPEVIIDEKNKLFRMYYHGLGPEMKDCHCTSIASSEDGLDFKSITNSQVVNGTYIRVFNYGGNYYAVERSGKLFRSENGIIEFEEGPNPFNKINLEALIRHTAVMVKGDTLFMFYSRIGDTPERIMVSHILLNNGWNTWRASPPVTILAPEMDYEGADLALRPSEPGSAEKVRELRDPDIFIEDEKIYLLYSVQGESGIAIAELRMK